MSQHRPRKGRVSLPEYYYHITTCTYERRPIFLTFDCARVVIGEMQKLQRDGVVTSLTWVLMPEHLHWLIQLHRTTSLSNALQLLKGRSSHCLKQDFNIEGKIWQKGFYDHAMRRDEDLVAVSRYIIANPLRAGLVKKPGDYPFWDSVYL